MVRTYIPGFTNSLEPLDAPEYFGGPAYVDLPPEEVVPSAPPIMLDQYAQPAAPATMAPPLEQPFTAPQFSDLFPNGLDQETLAAMLSTAPGAVVSPAASQPGPGAGLVTTPGGEQGFYFYTDKGRLAGYDGKGGFIAADPNAQYRMYDERGKNRIVAEGTGVDALQNIYNIANQFNKEQGKKANWGIERLNPATGQWERISENDPAKNVVGQVIGGALPLAMLAIPGFGQMGFLAQAAIGAGLGGAGAAIAGRDPLKGAIIGGLTAGAGGLGGELGAAGKLGSIGAKTGAVIGSGVGATAGGLATGQSIGQALKGGALSAAGTFGGQQLGGALRDMGIDLPAYRSPTPSTPGNIVVTPTGGVSIPVSTGLGSGGGQPKAPTAEPDAGGIDGAYDSYIEAIGNRVKFGALPGLGAGLPAVLPEGVPTTPEEVARRQAEQEEGQINVTGSQVPNVPTTVPVSPGFDYTNGPLSNIIPTKPRPTQAEQEQEGQIDVVRDRLVSNMAGGAPSFAPIRGAPLLPPNLPQAVLDSVRPETPQENEIVVSGSRVPNVPVGPVIKYNPVTGNVDEIIAARQKAASGEKLTDKDLDLILGSGAGASAEGVLEAGKVPEKSILDKLKENLSPTDYMRLAALGLGLLGGGGGGGRGALATIPGGMFGGGSGVFGGRLPAATLPGATGNFAPRTAAELRPQTTQDWYRYGYGPEQSFFKDVPQGAPNTSRAYTGYEQAEEDKGFAVGGMAGGGASNSYAVNGPGTGRSDEIPALLSDGEYVIDAETVALLGDGSSKAGAERLDQLRVKIRKDKGRKLAKGEFSGNAKRPEHYLKGGRA